MVVKNQYNKNVQQPRAIDFSTMVYGKVPPQAKELEEAVLGAIMLEKTGLDYVSGMLTPESFYFDAHQRIFRAIESLNTKNQPIDILTVVQELRMREELDIVGGPYYVTSLTNSVVSSANIVFHAKIIMQKYLQRELIRIAGEVITEAYEDKSDVGELLNYAEESILSIGQKFASNDMLSVDQVLVQAMDRIEKWRSQDNSITGVPSGFPDLDRATRGWQPGLIILAARPSVGKSALALNLIRNAVKNSIRPVPVAVWSLEMDAVSLVLRMVAAESKTLLHHIQTGQLDDSQMQRLYREGIMKLAGEKIFFNDQSSVTIQTIRSKARELKRKHNIGLIVLDYLQLVTGSGEGNREQEISKISRELKKLSRELELPIISLSQLSREVEKRTGSKRSPQLSDLRESGAIEQDADLVIFLWGPDDEEIKNDNSLLNRRYARIAKQREGMLLSVDLNFQSEFQLFEQIQKDDFSTPVAKVSYTEGRWKPVDIRQPYNDPKEEKDLPF